MMEFLKEEIYEARMLRDDGNARLLTYTDCCQRLYLVLLCLELMRHFPKYSDVVKRYAGKNLRNSLSFKGLKNLRFD